MSSSTVRAPASAGLPLQRAAVMVKISAPDNGHALAQQRPFYDCTEGSVTASASGILVDTWHVVTSASIVAPFLSIAQSRRREPRRIGIRDIKAETKCSVFVPAVGTSAGASGPASVGDRDEHKDEDSNWMKAQLIAVATCDLAQQAVARLHRGRFRFGWIGKKPDGTRCGSFEALWPSGVAILKLSTPARREMVPSFSDGVDIAHGSSVWTVSSPYGALCPNVFFNSVSSGVISSVINNSGEQRASGMTGTTAQLLISDARCLAGSEGGAAFDADGHIIGIICPPLQTHDNTSVDLSCIIPWRQVVTALGRAWAGGPELPKCLTQTRTNKTTMLTVGVTAAPGFLDSKRSTILPNSFSHGRHAPSPSPLPSSSVWQRVIGSPGGCGVVMVTAGASWGSGIVIGSQYVVTSGHIFAPFLPVSASSGQIEDRMEDRSSTASKPSPWKDGVLFAPNTVDPNKVDIAITIFDSITGTRGYRRHREIVDVVHIARGSFDIAILKRRCDPSLYQSNAVAAAAITNVSCTIAPCSPKAGDAVAVVGFPLLDPNIAATPVITTGCIARLVNTASLGTVMIQSTAMVHRGNSGGPMVDAHGRVIGVVTCNARHPDDERDVMTNFNFAIPVSSGPLRPMFSAMSVGQPIDAWLPALDDIDYSVDSVWGLYGPWMDPVDDATQAITGVHHRSRL